MYGSIVRHGLHQVAPNFTITHPGFTDKTDTNVSRSILLYLLHLKMFYVYLLESSKNTTYVGATVNLNRRLRQHNGQLSGGAKFTGRVVARGGEWKRVCYVSGFPSWKCALQFEWKWKYLTRKQPLGNSLQRRLEALNVLLASDRSTSSAIPFSMYTPRIHEN